MTAIPIHIATDRTSRLILLAALIFGAIYLLDDFGLGTPYPLNVVIKAGGVVLLGLYALKQGRLWLGLGLLAGSAGDAFLALEPTQQALGILAFGIGHLIYIGLFADQLRRKGNRGLPGYLATAVIAAFGVVMLVALQPHFGELRVAASVYNGIILVMVALALIGRAPPLAVIGALLFMVSDAVLAWRMFAGMLDWAGPVVWVCYFGGQACIAVGLSQQLSPAGELQTPSR
ncbi:lysoplasmalogenase [uncultured Maricaulis sp.]|uniref:lysoplasmalogenase n=1 Tax=uncultured Maricaulis sp. TaxID=174710 RepID=UPI0030D9E4FE|tara:strand:- start:7700 stop:8392 length:693 start_codon:yes stop_codon:yes gene_type:complete